MWTSSTSKQFGPVAWLACIVLFMIGGILLIWPNESLEAIAITVGIVILIRGIIETSVGLADRRRRGWKFLLTRGLITIALGIFFLWFPNWAAYLLLILIGIDFIARGVSGVSRARQLQKQQG
jgi:uncharacterized membrane protein HdeD (DUF308 family)